MRSRLIGGVLMCLVGAIWILQGVNVIHGSGMSGHAIWAVLGVGLVLGGGGLVRAARQARP